MGKLSFLHPTISVKALTQNTDPSQWCGRILPISITGLSSGNMESTVTHLLNQLLSGQAPVYLADDINPISDSGHYAPISFWLDLHHSTHIQRFWW